MNTILFLPLGAALLVLASPNSAPPVSDPAGVYALIERVVLLPDEAKADRVELHGAFAIAAGRHGDYYTAPRWGRLFLRAADGKADECRGHWHDLQSVAGTGQIVTFSSRYSQQGVRVLGTGEPLGEPALQGTDFGVNKVRNQEWGPVRSLLLLPKPQAPAGVGITAPEGGRYNGQTIEFKAGNCASDLELRYVFEVDTGRERLASPPIAPGKDTTTWKTDVFLVAGDRVTWSVRVVGEKIERAPVAEASFVVGKEEARRR